MAEINGLKHVARGWAQSTRQTNCDKPNAQPTAVRIHNAVHVVLPRAGRQPATEIAINACTRNSAERTTITMNNAMQLVGF